MNADNSLLGVNTVETCQGKKMRETLYCLVFS